MKKENALVVSRRKNTRKYPYLDMLEWGLQERVFIILLGLAFILAGFAIGDLQVAMWFGFAFAGYSAIANDSIQTLGTFIESNRKRPWYLLWLFTGSILIGTLTISFFIFDGDVTYQRLLDSEGNTSYPHPDQFSYFQVIAPVVLLLLTRLRMPVSTTFLLLSVFSSTSDGITSVITKSLSGYVLAFVLSFLIWYLGYNGIRKYFKKRKARSWWTVTQWIVSGSLWAVWLMQDGANIAVFLPRQLNGMQFSVFLGVLFVGMGFLFYMRGDRIQQVVSEKVRISDVRAATLVDFTFVLLLIYKLLISTVPMSTTWVFLGVIGGREIAIGLSRKKKGHKHKQKALRLIGKDLGYALIGLAVSVVLASGANPAIREDLFDFFGF